MSGPRFLRRSLLPLACFVIVAALPSVAPAAPTLPLGHAGRWITDASGRVVIVHGTNMVYKLPPYYPDAIGFGDDDAAFLASIGFDAVRVGVIWKAVEPQPGVYDDAYLNHIAVTVATLARHGVVSLLDFHQDLFNERFQGEGAPDWAVQDGGLPNPKLGFPSNYLGNPALEHALDAFWSNAPGPGGVGLQDRFAAAWAHVAARFKGNRAVLGYEVFNEPFPGALWQPCLIPSGCPGFDGKLSAFYRRVDTATRAVDRRTLIWHEPNVLFNNGTDTRLAPPGDARSGFAFHDYCLGESATGSPNGCYTIDNTVFAHTVGRAARTGEAVMETEFGATNDIAYLDQMVQRGDRYMVPWLEWAYTGYDPTTSGPGLKQSIVADPRRPPTGANLVLGTLHALVEPYPQVIAGTPARWSFDATAGGVKLTYATVRADGDGRFAAGSLSEIAAPALTYPSGYAAQASGAAIVSVARAGTLVLASCPGARTVSVTITPSGPTGGSCRPRLRVSATPGSVTAGHSARFRILVLAVLGRYRVPVAGAAVTFGGRRLRTDARGIAIVRLTLHRALRPYAIRVRAAGLIPGATTVRALSSR